MFPQTPHIECVALFERDASRVAAPGREEAEEAATDV